MRIFKGKSVAFVGMAPCIEWKGLGYEIDSFDVVYRANYLPKNTLDFGSKCDVMSVLKDHFNMLDTHSVQNIIVFDDLELPRNKYLVTEKQRKEIRQKFLDYYGLDIIDATAGLIAYCLAKKFGCDRFKFFGITGYQDLKGDVKNHSELRHYVDENYDTLGAIETVWDVDMKNYDCHNFKNQNDVFRKLLKQGLIEMDEYSMEYFKINERD